MSGSILLAILVAAVITFMLRALPFLIFSGDRQMPKRLVLLGNMLPSAIMAVLIVYCMRSVASDLRDGGLLQLPAAAVVIATYHRQHNTFLSIVSGTAVYMLLIQLL